MSNNAKGSKKVLIVVVVVLIACLILILIPSSVFERKSDTIPTLSGGATVSTREDVGRLNKDYNSGGSSIEPTTPSLTTAVEYMLDSEVREALDGNGRVEVPDTVRNFITNLDPARIDMGWLVDLDEKRVNVNYPLSYGTKNAFVGLLEVISTDSKSKSPKWAGIKDAVYLGYVGGDNRGFCAFSMDLSAGLTENIIVLKLNLPKGYIVGDRLNITFTTNNTRLLTIDGNKLLVGE